MFTDLRGYTSFVERAGNAAGAELISDYGGLVRECVAAHGGAEVKTEGDAFYVVFPSASAAVVCGLAIVDAAAGATAARPERPIHIGVGVHAGEVVEHGDTFIGSAVNVAARVCAVAKSGEVLVTSTVRGVTQGSIPVSFTPRGRKRLKGITDPVELFAVTEQGKAVQARALPRWVLIAAIVGGVAAVAVIGVVVASMLGSPAPTPLPTPSPTPINTTPPLVVGSLAIGEYEAREFRPPFSFVIEEAGWQAYRAESDYVGLMRDAAPEGNLDIGKVRGLLTDPCIAEGLAVSAGETPEDLMEAIKDLLYITPGEERELTLGDFEGKEIDFTISEAAMAACGSIGTGDVAVFRFGAENWSATPGERVTLGAIDVNGETVSIITSTGDPTGSIQANEQFRADAERIIQSMEF